MKKIIIAVVLALVGCAAQQPIATPQHCGCPAAENACSVPCSSCCAPDPCICTDPHPSAT